MTIIEKYPGSELMLGILKEKLKATGKGRKTIIYKNVTDQTNRNLKKSQIYWGSPIGCPLILPGILGQALH
jgi:hypothetical protein